MRAAGNPQRHVAVAQEPAGRDELVDLIERAADVQFAQAEIGQAALGKAAAAGVGARRVAQRAGGRHHLPVIGADRVVVVQRHDDRRARQHAADQSDRLHAERHQVMDVHHVRPLLGEQGGERTAPRHAGRSATGRTGRSRRSRAAARRRPLPTAWNGVPGLCGRWCAAVPARNRPSTAGSRRSARNRSREKISVPPACRSGWACSRNRMRIAQAFSNMQMSWKLGSGRPLQWPYWTLLRRRPWRRNFSSRKSSSNATAASGASRLDW